MIDTGALAGVGSNSFHGNQGARHNHVTCAMNAILRGRRRCAEEEGAEREVCAEGEDGVPREKEACRGRRGCAEGEGGVHREKGVCRGRRVCAEGEGCVPREKEVCSGRYLPSILQPRRNVFIKPISLSPFFHFR